MNRICGWSKPLLSRYADGDLDVMRRYIVKAHLKACPSCSSEIQEVISAKELLREAQSGLKAPRALRASVMARVTAESSLIPARRQWFMMPEFSWGMATAVAVLAMFFYLADARPSYSACKRVFSISQDAGAVARKVSASDISSILKVAPGKRRLIYPSALTLYNIKDCDGEGAVVAQMTVKDGDGMMLYSHGKEGDIKPLFQSGVSLRSLNIDGKSYFVGEFEEYKLVVWRDGADNPVAILVGV